MNQLNDPTICVFCLEGHKKYKRKNSKKWICDECGMNGSNKYSLPDAQEFEKELDFLSTKNRLPSRSAFSYSPPPRPLRRIVSCQERSNLETEPPKESKGSTGSTEHPGLIVSTGPDGPTEPTAYRGILEYEPQPQTKSYRKNYIKQQHADATTIFAAIEEQKKRSTKNKKDKPKPKIITENLTPHAITASGKHRILFYRTRANIKEDTLSCTIRDVESEYVPYTATEYQGVLTCIENSVLGDQEYPVLLGGVVERSRGDICLVWSNVPPPHYLQVNYSA